MADLSSLLVRIRTGLQDAEDKARAAMPGPWKSGGDYAGAWPEGGDPEPNYWRCWQWDEAHQDVTGLAHVDCEKEADADFIAAHDPASVLATVTVLRTLVENLTFIAEKHKNEAGACWECFDFASQSDEAVARPWPCPTSLAAISSLEAVSRLPFIGGDRE